MAAFRSGRRPSGESLKKMNEAKSFPKPKRSIKPPKRKPVKNENVSGMMESSGNFMKKVFQNKFDPKGKKITGERKQITKNLYPRAGEKAGGRIGLKAGTKGCKLAMKGKGKAYGKNS